MNTPTPVTDAEDARLTTLWDSWPRRHEGWLNFARRLERERDAARAALSGRTVSCSNCNELGYKLAGFDAEVAGLRADNEEMREAIRVAHDAIKASPYPDQHALAKLQPFTTP